MQVESFRWRKINLAWYVYISKSIGQVKMEGLATNQIYSEKCCAMNAERIDVSNKKSMASVLYPSDKTVGFFKIESQ